LVRAKFLIDAVGYDRVRGKPFRIAEIIAEAERVLGVGSTGGDAFAQDDHSPNATGGVD
jgi:hypothetical protein